MAEAMPSGDEDGEDGGGGGDARRRHGFRLSTKLVALTALFVVVAELLVFVPSMAHFRINRLNEMVQRAQLVAMALGSTPMIGRALQDGLLAEMDASAISVRAGNMRRLVAMSDPPPTEIDRTIDLGQPSPWRWSFAGVETLWAGDGRTIRILSAPENGHVIDLVMDETPVRRAMVRFAVNLLVISIGILMVVAVTTFVVLRHMFLRPLRRLTGAMADFAADPEDPARVIRASARDDEIGDAERRLADLQRDLAGALAQKRHLAEDRKSTRLNSSHTDISRMPSSA